MVKKNDFEKIFWLFFYNFFKYIRNNKTVWVKGQNQKAYSVAKTLFLSIFYQYRDFSTAEFNF